MPSRVAAGSAAMTVVTLPLAASARRTASVGVPRSTATSKRAQHRRQPLAQFARDAVDEKGHRSPRAGALAALAQEMAVEDGRVR